MTQRTGRGGGSQPGAAPAPRSWAERIEDPDEPLYTVAVVGDLLGIDSQTLRRLGAAISQTSARPSGNQRRYSRRDIEHLAAASDLANEGYPALAIGRILDLERQVTTLAADRPSATTTPSTG